MSLDNTSILPPLPVEDEESKRKRLAGQQKPIIPAVQPAGGGEDYSRFIHPFVGNTREGEATRQASMMKSAAESVTPPSPMATPVNLPAVGPKIGINPEVQAAQEHLKQAQDKANQHHSVIRKIFEGVGTFLAPGLMMSIPGTILNSYWERNQAQGAMNDATGNAEREAQTQKALQPPNPTNDFELWHQQNPQGTSEDWMKLQNANKPHPVNSALDLWLRDNPQGSAADYRKFENDSKAPKETSFNANEVAYAHEHGKKPEDLTTAELNDANRGKKEATTVIQPQRQMMYVPQPDGTTKVVEVTPGSTVPKGATMASGLTEKPASEGERRAYNFYLQAKQAAEAVEAIEPKIAEKGAVGTAFMNTAPNFMQPEENQLYTQAQRQFTEARLRNVSGAAISASEYEKDAKTYFAQPGDLPAVRKQKKTARDGVIKSLAKESGRALEPSEAQGGGKETHYRIVNGQLVPE